ncbi:MAG: T9SS type A sorting domain-containing protein, partial [Bacteroidia bacterium]|nr:T9SS type A sorting domain-containing protein [Bacteroidia bacterium]
TDTIFCNGDQTAKLQANVIGGTAPYTYIWNSNPIQTTNSASGLGAGTYSVIVTDANGCTSSCSYEVIEPSVLSCTTTSTDAFCNADSSGTATVNASGGTPNILPCHFVSFNVLTDGFPNETYWMVQDGSSLDTLIYNPLGTYTQGVNDSTVFSDSLCLTEGDTLIFTIFDDFNDGIFEPGGYWITIGGDTVASNFAFATFTASELVTIPIADTTNTYHYLWSNGDTTQTASNLTSGTYTVTVTDLYGCSTTCTVEIGESDPILTSISSSNSLCAGDSSGTASVTATGGTPGVFATLPGNQTSGSSLTGPSFSVLSGGALSGRPFDDGSCCDYNDPSTDILKFTVDVSGSYTINNDYLPSFAWDGYLLLYTDPLDWTQSPPITFVDGNDDCLFYNTSCITVNLNAGQNYYLVTTGFSDFDNGSWLTSFSGPGNAGLSLGDYAYQWSNGATTQTVGNLGAGTYYVTVTDGNGCTAIDSITIGGSTALQMDTITSTSVTCKGDADGTASIGNVSGGNTPYTVEWNTTPPQFTATALGLAPGIYSATVTDANGCTIIDSVEVTEPDEVLSLFLDGVQTVDCAGGSTGSATVLASGGTPPYSYLWSDGQVTGSATNLSAQIYVVTVTDENGCQDLISVPVASPFSLSVNVNKTDALCNSDSSGTASAVINGGTAPYSYIWLNALNDTLGTSSSVGSLYPGTYTIIVTDSSGCMAMNSFTIYQPSGLVQYTSVIDVTCNNGADGTATSIVFAGTPPYSYAWSNGQTTQTATNLTAGTYTVLITDGNGCVTVGDTAEIGQPVPILLNPNVTSLLCYGSDVGMIATQVTGGTPPYQYTWSTGESTPIISMLTAGVYTVTVSDLFGCTTDSVFTLVEADSISCTSVISMPSCNGGADGFITIDSTWGGTPSGSGPTGPINAIDTYCFSGQPFLSPGGISNVSTLSIPALPSGAIINSATLHLYGVNSINASWRSEFRVSLAGAYTLAPTQVDNNSSGGLISPDPSIPLVGFPATGGSIDLILSESFDDFGVDDATVDSACIIIDYTIPASGGGNSTAGYTYSWSNGQNGPTATGLTAGNWFVTITDSIGCSWTKCIKLPEPTALLCASSTIDISCFGEETGVVDLSVSGGTVFSTPPPVLVTAYSEDFETGAGGWASAGSANSWALGTPASGLIISAASGANAWITNLTGDYSVAEDSWVESPSIDLTPYISPVSVQFMINYETETSWDGAQLQSSIDGGTSWQQVGALNDPTNWYDDGSINGAGANWQTQEGWSGRFGSGSNGWVQASHDISGLTGASSVIFRVAFGSDFSGQDDGFAFDDFEVTAMQVGTATAPYTFAWSNGASTEDLNGVEAGTYTVTVTDGNGCTTICTATINQPDSISITASVNNASCALANGSLHAQGNGGAKPYTFLWSNGETTALINGLLSGNYTITITDLNGCTNSSVFVVDDTPVVLCSVSNFTEPTCNGYSDGTATATASGGTAPYSYSWNSNPVQLTQTANNLAAGVYIVTVTDSFGCTSTCSINLGQPDPITYSVQLGGNICSGTSTGSATVTVSGGTEPYIYVWSDGQSNSLATGLAAGNYYVTVTDVNGCSAIAPVSISTAQAISCNTYTVNSTCGMANGSAQVNVFGAVMPVTYLWSDGQDSSVAINLMAGNYTVTVTDANGCSTECYATVNTQGTLISYAIGLDVSCNGGNDGSASVLFVSGGTAPYSYQWSTGSTDSQILGLSVGTYVYTVTDSSGCVTIDSVEIVEPSVVGVTASGSNVSCYGYNDGSAAAVASGGSAPYLYTWSNGQGLSAINNLIAGTYTVTVSDANGCTSTDQITVLDGDSISCTFNIVDPALCEEPTGEVEIFPSGGTAPYTFVWATNPVQTTSTASNLPGGSVFVTITDANGCSKVECIKVPVQNGPQYSVVNSVFANGTNISCNGATDGFINVIIVSGGPVTYSWSNGATTSSISSLSAGTYTVMIAAGPCEISHTVTLVEPNALITSASGVDLNCAGVNSGLAMVNATGGTSPYSYSWNTIPPKFTPVITGLSAATYDVLVTDANGCTATNQVIISQPASVFSATENVTHISCNGLTDGMIDVTALGGQAPYLYNWMDGSTMEDRTGLSSGVYKLTISDNAGCAVIVCAAIAEPSLLLVGINSVGVSTPGGNDGSATAIATGGTWPYTYNWSNGTSTQSNSGLMSGFYIVTITDANGCTATESVEVLEPSSAFTSSGLSPEGFITKAIVYPNPNTGLFKLEIESTMNKEVYVDLFDISGRQLASDKLQLQDGVSSKEYNLQYAEKGIYFIRIYSDAKFEEVLRIILQ